MQNRQRDEGMEKKKERMDTGHRQTEKRITETDGCKTDTQTDTWMDTGKIDD